MGLEVRRVKGWQIIEVVSVMLHLALEAMAED